jgi:putative transposase
MALPISNDLRERVIRFYENHDDYTQQEIADEFGMSLSFLEKLLRRWRATGNSGALPHAGGRTSPLKPHDATLKKLVATQSDATLGELQAQLAAKKQLTVSEATISRALQRLRLVRKKRPNSPASKSARR